MGKVVSFPKGSNVCPFCGGEPHAGVFACPEIAEVEFWDECVIVRKVPTEWDDGSGDTEEG